MEQRNLLHERLLQEEEDGLAAILSACGEPLPLTCTCCGRERIVETRCKKRWCPVCARQISAKRVAKYGAAVEALQWPLFITLTRPNVKTINLNTIKELRRGLRRLRQQAWWKKCVAGGVASVEVTNTGKGWHPHIHAIIDCRWLAVKTPPPKPFEAKSATAAKYKQAGIEVSQRWAKALDVPRASIFVKRAYTPRTAPQMPKGSKSIAVEVLKYAVKPSDLIQSPEPIGELLRTIGAARLVSSWGSLYGRDLSGENSERTPAMCECGAAGHWLPDSVIDRIAGRPRKYC